MGKNKINKFEVGDLVYDSDYFKSLCIIVSINLKHQYSGAYCYYIKRLLTTIPAYHDRDLSDYYYVRDIEITFVRRSLMTIAQNIAGSMSLTEVISSNRADLQQRIEKELTIELVKMGFIVDKVMLGASHLPETIEEQMQQKMAAQQKAQQAEYNRIKTDLLFHWYLPLSIKHC